MGGGLGSMEREGCDIFTQDFEKVRHVGFLERVCVGSVY